MTERFGKLPVFLWVSCLLFLMLGAGVRAKDDGFTYVLYGDLTAQQVAHIEVALAENRDRVMTSLGLASLPPITVQIWRDEQDYQDAMEATLGMRAPGSRGYVTGESEIRLLFHNNLSAQKEAVHEFVHAATLNLNPDFGNNPRWLWEAAAIFLAGEFVDPASSKQFDAGECPSLETLSSPFDRGGSIYRSGYLLGEFITSKWGAAALPELIKANGDTLAALGTEQSAFEAGWCTFVQQKYRS